jgi:peptidoglycan/LPS O-acetylase OafA/YrhL
VWFAQALRGVACLCVVAYHLGFEYNTKLVLTDQIAALPLSRAAARPFWISPLLWLEGRSFDLGKFGVALFFLISGFVIPFSLRRGGVSSFAARRILRIYPLYWCALLLTVGVLLLQSHAHGTALPFSGRGVPLNAFMVQLYAGKASIDNVNWTLAIEELFYVIAATASLMGLLRRPLAIGTLSVLLAAITVLVGDLQPHNSAQWLLYALAFNLTGVEFILLGICWHHAFTGEWSRRTSVAVGGLIGLMWLLCVHVGPMQTAEPIVRVSSIAALLVFAAAFAARDSLRRSVAVDKLANVSYPLYLVHAIIGYILLSNLISWTGQFYVSLAITLGVVVGLASFLHRAIETRTIALGRRVGKGLDQTRLQPLTVVEVPTAAPAESSACTST